MCDVFRQLFCQNPALRRFAVTSYFLLALAVAARPAVATEHVKIKLDNVLCVSPTSGYGDDDTYLVAVGINLKTGRTRHLAYAFPSMGSGDRRNIAANQGFAFADHVDHPQDILVLGAVFEADHQGPFTGMIFQGGENKTGSAMAQQLGQEMDRLAKQYAGSVSSGSMSRQFVMSTLNQAFQSKAHQIKGKDDAIGFFSLNAQNALKQGTVWQHFLSGDGSMYQVLFTRFNSKIYDPKKILPVNTSMVRFRVRDANTKQTLAARVQLISNANKIIDDRKIQSDGKYEFAVVPGLYRARFTTPNSASHHTHVQQPFQVGASDFYQDIYLKPINGSSTNPSPPPMQVDLTGDWHATIFGQTIQYKFVQNGNQVQWSAPQLQETATVTFLPNDEVKADIKNPLGSDTIKGKLTKDASGNVVRIYWYKNKITFHRGQSGGGNPQIPPGSGTPGYDVNGKWIAYGAGQPIGYIIQQSGNQFTWYSPKLNESASGTINGNQLFASYSSPSGSGNLTGTITKNISGVATEISWQNGAVVFVRDQ